MVRRQAAAPGVLATRRAAHRVPAARMPQRAETHRAPAVQAHNQREGRARLLDFQDLYK